MQYSRSRDHLLSRSTHRSQINMHLADHGETPELAWYDDDFEDELEQLELSLVAEYEDQKQQEMENMREQEEYDHYVEEREDQLWDEGYWDEPIDPPPRDRNLTRNGADWKF